MATQASVYRLLSEMRAEIVQYGLDGRNRR